MYEVHSTDILQQIEFRPFFIIGFIKKENVHLQLSCQQALQFMTEMTVDTLIYLFFLYKLFDIHIHSRMCSNY